MTRIEKDIDITKEKLVIATGPFSKQEFSAAVKYFRNGHKDLIVAPVSEIVELTGIIDPKYIENVTKTKKATITRVTCIDNSICTHTTYTNKWTKGLNTKHLLANNFIHIEPILSPLGDHPVIGYGVMRMNDTKLNVFMLTQYASRYITKHFETIEEIREHILRYFSHTHVSYLFENSNSYFGNEIIKTLLSPSGTKHQLKFNDYRYKKDAVDQIQLIDLMDPKPLTVNLKKYLNIEIDKTELKDYQDLFTNDFDRFLELEKRDFRYVEQLITLAKRSVNIKKEDK